MSDGLLNHCRHGVSYNKTCQQCEPPRASPVASPEAVSIPREVAERVVKALNDTYGIYMPLGQHRENVACIDALRTALQGREKT